MHNFFSFGPVGFVDRFVMCECVCIQFYSIYVVNLWQTVCISFVVYVCFGILAPSLVRAVFSTSFSVLTSLPSTSSLSSFKVHCNHQFRRFFYKKHEKKISEKQKKGNLEHIVGCVCVCVQIIASHSVLLFQEKLSMSNAYCKDEKKRKKTSAKIKL